MRRIVAIVEGHGEVEAVPILLRRIGERLSQGSVEIPRPIRIKRQGVLKTGELERVVELAARRAGPAGGILILLDADRDCPKALAPTIVNRAASVRDGLDVKVVLAKTEYEAWFLAAVQSISGQRDIAVGVTPPSEPESIRDAKFKRAAVVIASTAAPGASRILTTCTLAARAAIMSGVRPLVWEASASEPAASSVSTMAGLAFPAARCNSVAPWSSAAPTRRRS